MFAAQIPVFAHKRRQQLGAYCQHHLSRAFFVNKSGPFIVDLVLQLKQFCKDASCVPVVAGFQHEKNLIRSSEGAGNDSFNCLFFHFLRSSHP